MKVPHLEDPMPATNIRVAVAALMKTLAQEGGPHGITAKTEEWYRKMLPVGRWGRPDEMGALVAFLCSQHAGFLTGETIRIDGGYTKSLF